MTGGGTRPAVECRGLTKRYPKTLAVDRLDLEVSRAECLGLLGPNGAGKTTTVEMLEGLTAPSDGTVSLFGQTWGRGNDHALRGRLGIQLQESELLPKLTVYENLRLFASFYSNPRPLDEVVDLVELAEKRDTRFEKLSGGQKQRLSLATALVGNPELLFLDEPTTGLDPQARLKIWDIVERFRADGGTVLLTTHYMEEAARLCTRVAILDLGKIIAMGTPAELVASVAADQIVEFRIEGQIGTAELEELPGVHSASLRDSPDLARRGRIAALSATDAAATLPELLSALERRGLALEELSIHQPTLEDVFVHLTGKGLRDG